MELDVSFFAKKHSTCPTFLGFPYVKNLNIEWKKAETMTDQDRLRRIRLKGFRSIRETDLELGPMNLLIGPNGAGKSNFVGFFRLMNHLVRKDLQFFFAQQGGADRFLYFGRKHTDAIRIWLSFDAGDYACTLAPDQTGRVIFREEYCERIGRGIRKREELTNAGSKESELSDKSAMSSMASDLTRHFSDWHVHHFHDTSDTAKIRHFCTIYDNERLRPQGENLAPFLFSIQNTPEYRRIVQTVQRVAPFFQGFILKPDKTDPDRIRLRWKHRGTDDYFDANALSDGSLRFICLATLLLQPDPPAMILLDEPELGLHPYAIDLLAGMMRSASQQTQIIASSQSVTLANQFGWQELIIAEQPDHASCFGRLEQGQVRAWQDAYRMGDLWEKNLIGGTPPC